MSDLPLSDELLFGPQAMRQARAAVTDQRNLIGVLEEQSGLDPDSFVRALGSKLRYQALDINDIYRLAPAFDVVPFAAALQRECLALRDTEGRLHLVIGDPFDTRLCAWAEEQVGEDFRWCIAHRKDVAAYLARHEETLRAMDSMTQLAEQGPDASEGVEQLSFKRISEDTSPVVKLVHSTIYDAMRAGASDIHLESGQSGLTIKYRIDGVLRAVGDVGGVDLAEQVISRIKVMSELDISERRIPQDGRFKVAANGKEVDFRVSIMPCIFGEDSVLRILDKQAVTDQIKGLRLDYLGFDPTSMAAVRRLSAEAHGMLLVTGPTGSGKTTTLYAAISEINNGQDKIITIEDPVEYQLPGVLQIPVNEKKGLTFARGLRSILRHDPDKIMVGEIRDPETAQIAIQSALTGHLVFTTVHANNVFDVIGRFIHMGVDPYSFVSAMNGVLAQRLVRINCPHCSVEEVPPQQLVVDSGLQPGDVSGHRAGRGCGQCHGTGYRGRKAIAEVLTLNDEIRELIIGRHPVRMLREAARANGTRFLRESAIALMRAGETTLQEINRVTLVS
ncbi:MAG: type II/IV secretion system protein [Rhodocyclales bacterium]|nr:type II/IV secretion system protein [Rhodocyclales bacterium]